MSTFNNFDNLINNFNNKTESLNLRKIAEKIFSNPQLFRNFLRSYPELTQNLLRQNKMTNNESLLEGTSIPIQNGAMSSSSPLLFFNNVSTTVLSVFNDASNTPIKSNSKCMRFVELDPDPTNSPIVITVFGFIYANIFLLGLIGNISIVCLTFRHRHLQIVQNVFILNLALSDIIVCLLSLPFTPVTNVYKNWIFGQPICHLLPLVQAVSVFVSTFSLSIIAIDRYILVVKPYSHPMTVKDATVLATVMWIISVLVSIPYAYYMTLEEYPGYCGQFCSEHWPNEFVRRCYAILVLTLQFIVPFSTMTICYTTIFSRLKKRANSKLKKLNERSLLLSSGNKHAEVNNVDNSVLKFQNDSPKICSINSVSKLGAFTNDNNISTPPILETSNHKLLASSVSAVDERQRTNLLTQQRRTTTILASMVLIFGLTWLPQNVVTLLIEYDENILHSESTNYTYLVSMIAHNVAMITNVTNPILYAWLNPTFKRLFLEAFKRNSKKNFNKYEHSTIKSTFTVNSTKMASIIKVKRLKDSENQQAV